MARATRKTKKTSTPRRSRSASITAEEKNIGIEVTNWADVKPEDFEDAMYSTLRHYNYFYDHKESAKWAKAWVKKNYDKKVYSIFAKSEDWRISTTVGAMCKMMDNGATFSERRMNWIDSKIQEVVKAVNAKQQEKKLEPVSIQRKSPADIVKERTSDFIGAIEETIDMFDSDTHVDWDNYSVYNELQVADLPYNTAKAVADYYAPQRDELKELVEDKTEDLVEAYRHLTVRKRKQLLKIVQGIIDDAEKYMASKKAVRKPRKKKVTTASQQVSKVKYLQSSNEYKVTSVDPTSIVGAREVYLFNVKTRTATYLVSDASKGFAIKGTTIQHIDAEQSYKKRLRKPEEWLSAMSKITKAKARKSLKDLKTKQSEANGRINADTIVLKVY